MGHSDDPRIEAVQQTGDFSSVRAHGSIRHNKRLTLNFPINLNLPDASTSYPSASSAAMPPSSAQSSTRPSPPLPVGTPLSLDQAQGASYDFLTAIASQERKVLELREELQRAEADLASLKKQWTLSERVKKTTEISYRAQPMLPLKSPEPRSSEESSRNGSRSRSSSRDMTRVQDRVSRELDRRSSVRVAAALPAGTTISANGRRVYQGSHARALSLLSPGLTQSSTEDGKVAISEAERIARTPRSATLPSVDGGRQSGFYAPPPSTLDENNGYPKDDVLSQWRKSVPPPSREALVRTGRQMAADLKEGLWTFLEDIRQATVGQEGINATESRTVPAATTLAPPSTSTARSRDRLSVRSSDGSSRSPSGRRGAGPTSESGKHTSNNLTDIAASFWSEFGVDTPGQKTLEKARLLNPPASTPNVQTGSAAARNLPIDDTAVPDTDDNWDMWDTPRSRKAHTPSSSRSTVASKQDQSPRTQASSPRTSASFGDWAPNTGYDHAVPDTSISDSIPWPVVTKLASSRLTRTASDLMTEWERNLFPVPEKGSSGPPHFVKQDKHE